MLLARGIQEMNRRVFTALPKAALAAALMAAPLPSMSQASGCGAVGLSSGSHTMRHNGLERVYRVYVPPGYNSNVPSRMVLVFHGWSGTEAEFLDDHAVIDVAGKRGYILVAPRGLGSGSPDQGNNSWSFPGSATGLDGDGVNRKVPGDTDAICDASVTPDYRYPSCKGGTARNTCSWTQCQDDDVDFTLALVRHVESQLCVDRKHIYAAGGSNGGMFVWELGQNPLSAPIFRAIAPLIGLPHRGYLIGPGKKPYLPVLLITGLADDVVPPGAWDDDAFTTTSNARDRFYYTGATAIMKQWAEAAGCGTSGKEVAFRDARTPADCRTYCPVTGSQWPAALDCRAKMGHDYGLPWSWSLIMDFFDHS